MRLYAVLACAFGLVDQSTAAVGIAAKPPKFRSIPIYDDITYYDSSCYSMIMHYNSILYNHSTTSRHRWPTRRSWSTASSSTTTSSTSKPWSRRPCRPSIVEDVATSRVYLRLIINAFNHCLGFRLVATHISRLHDSEALAASSLRMLRCKPADSGGEPGHRRAQAHPLRGGGAAEYA